MKQDFVVAYCERHNEILIVNKDRPDWMKGRINLPGGKIDPEDAGPLAAAIRELKEESGLDPLLDPSYPEEAEEVGLVLGNGFKIHIVKIEVDYSLPIEPRPGETEIVEWVPWYNLRHNPRLMPNLRVIIPLLLAGVEGWQIRDDGTSWGNPFHNIGVEVPTYQDFTSGDA